MPGTALEIKINHEALESKISSLKTLKADCESIDVSPRTAVGGGKSIRYITMLDEYYTDVRSALVDLIDNSISFFENVNSSVKESDNLAASSMKE